jgi:hypothetical protein
MPHNRLILLSIPLILSFFVHLWNPLGFPPTDFDEGIYMRRAMHVIEGQGPQESENSFALYDHPYFGQLFLAAALAITGYPESLNPTPTTMHSIEALYLIPKILMAVLAVVDTFLLYKIAERQYNNVRIALIGSILFAVMPVSWLLRDIWLEPIQLPFLLSSIFFAISMQRRKSDATIILDSKNGQSQKNVMLIMLSGIFLGLAIFAKVPAFTMIPLVGFVIVKANNRNLKVVSMWILPVIIIPLIWPIFSIISGQFSSWLHGIYFQSTREGLSLFDSLAYVLNIDPFMMGLGLIGLLFAAIKKDLFLVLWIVPFLLFLLFIGTTAYFHLLPILPALCLGSARLIDSLLGLASNKRIQKSLSIVAITSLVGFGLISTIPIISQNINPALIETSAFISKYLYENTTRTSHDATTVISNPFYQWIPQYVYNLKAHFVPYYSIVSIKNDNVLLVKDNGFMSAVESDPIISKIDDLLEKRGLIEEVFRHKEDNNNVVTLVSNNISRVMSGQNKTLNLLDDNHVWKPFGGANITQNIDNRTLSIRVSNSSKSVSDDRYSGASLLTRVNLSQRPLLLSLEYTSKSSIENPTFYAEITDNKENGKSVTDYLLNTFYAEITENNNRNYTNALDDILDTFHAEINKNSTGKILWNDILDNTNGNLAKETYVFPRLGATASNGSINSNDNKIEFRLYIIHDVPGDYELMVQKARII